MIADVQDDKGRAVAATIDGTYVRCDITDSAAVQDLIEGVASDHGSVDVVVANAGIAPTPKAMHTIDDDEWQLMMRVNGFGTFSTCKFAVRQMLKQESGGVILANSSVCGMTGHSGSTSYNFTKAGIISLTKTVAVEYRKKRIRMNCICPNTTNTELVRNYVEHCTDEVKESLMSLNPVPGMIQPSHVASVAAMLCAPNEYLTGVAVPIDGGYLAAAPTYKLYDYVALAEAQSGSE